MAAILYTTPHWAHYHSNSTGDARKGELAQSRWQRHELRSLEAQGRLFNTYLADAQRDRTSYSRSPISSYPLGEWGHEANVLRESLFSTGTTA